MITNRKLLTLALAIAMSAWIFPTWAHHSHGNYRMTEYTHLSGTVKELHWMNPHTWMHLDVAGEDGKTALWVLEGGSPTALIRRGWSRDSVQVGDEVSVRCHRLRDGSNGCLYGFVTPPNGEEMMWD